jgi:hypothetical protein
MENQDNYKMFDLMKYSNAYNLGWRFSRYANSSRMKAVISNISKFNKGDSFADGLLQGFEAGRSKQNPEKKMHRKNELDHIFKSKEKSRDSEKER